MANHLGPMGINSPGYGPRRGTPEAAAAEQWMKDYWANLLKSRKTVNGVSVRSDV